MMCAAPSVGVGEHVWPTWLLDDFDDEGPFTVGRSGSPITRRDDITPIGADRMYGVHVPMCGACNHALGVAVEEPAKPVVRQILQVGERESLPDLQLGEAEALARWAAKVAMLLQHPDARHDNERVERIGRESREEAWHPQWASWLPGALATPSALSVYATRRAWRWEGEYSGARASIFLPRLTVDGVDQCFMTWGCGIRGLDLRVVWHPNWEINHPLVATGRAARVWPARDPVLLSTLPVVDPRELSFVPAVGRLVVSQARFSKLSEVPLGVDADPLSLFFGFVSDN